MNTTDNSIFKDSGKRTILIVDDSVENLQVLSALLKDDYKVRVAKNGTKALELANEEVDLILLDVMMPDLNGYEVCTRLKNNPVTSSIPVIFLTSLNEASDETMGFQAGGADFITKPFNAEVVIARIRTHIALRDEKRKTDALLDILLPRNVIHELIHKGTYTPIKHPETSIMFCDIDGFTAISGKLSPEDLIRVLTEIFTEFDEIATSNGVTRIKTIGDAYMAVSGIEQESSTHAHDLVKTGFAFIESLRKRNETSSIQWRCRIGIHSGEIVSGLVGKTRFQFDVMGDNVNIAARVESHSAPMSVTVTEETRRRLPDGHYQTIALGDVHLKGKGEMALFQLLPL